MSGTLQERLVNAWRRSDQIFDLVRPDLLEEQPVPIRHPLIFYLGHLPAFAWNQVCRGVLGMPSFHPEFDALFERGIDPVGVDRHDAETLWPKAADVLAYRDRVREILVGSIDAVADRAESDPLADKGRIFEVAIEHELMHQETLQYLLLQLPTTALHAPSDRPDLSFDGPADNAVVTVEGGPVRLGADFDSLRFGWDNEFPVFETTVDSFRIDRLPARVGEFLEFVEAGGYQQPELWTDLDWRWRERVGIEHPKAWSRGDGVWVYRTLFDRVGLEKAAHWPVYVSLAEARAYCRWRGGRLATEAEFHRAAHTSPENGQRRFPWGQEQPSDTHGNLDFRHWGPTPAGSYPAGDSGWGVSELVGNGWEWTATPFSPFPGFKAYIRSYPGYSADFFDERHFVMLGASWATPTGLIRRSFRNWFQDHYPYVFAKFRCVWPV
jgi:ergothioneine biosynthesis protein EgtB